MGSLLIFGFILSAVYSAKFLVTADYGCAKENQLKTVALRKHLLCDYDPFVRPSDSGRTTVKLQLIPKFIEFIDSSYTLVLHSWLWANWEDPHLTWDAKNGEYSGIRSVHFSSSEIWSPTITVYSDGDMDHELSGLPQTVCVVSNNKKVSCLPAVKYTTRCTPNYQHWPFDRQNCTIRLGSWAYGEDEVDLQLLATGLTMLDYTASHEWKVLSANVTKRVLSYKGFTVEDQSVYINFVLERHSIHKQATVIIPAILLIVMTITVLWLDPMSVERMIVAGLNLICHLLCIMDIDWQVPFNSDSLPSILVFHQNSMIMAGVAFFLTAFLRQLNQISIPPPVWLTSAASMILESKAGQFILLTTLDPKASATAVDTAEEDNAGLVQLNPSSTAWHHFATLIDRLSFASIILTYAIMLIVLIPKNDFING